MECSLGRSGPRVSGRGDSKGSGDLSATDGVHLKNSKKHVKPGVVGLGG